jgi:hypothetical protein
VAWKGGKLDPALSPNEVPEQKKNMCRGKSRDQPNHSLPLFIVCIKVIKVSLSVAKDWPFVFCRLCPFSPQLPQQCWTPTCHLSTLNLHCVAGAGLPIHMIGEVSWEPKRVLAS